MYNSELIAQLSNSPRHTREQRIGKGLRSSNSEIAPWSFYPHQQIIDRRGNHQFQSTRKRKQQQPQAAPFTPALLKPQPADNALLKSRQLSEDPQRCSPSSKMRKLIRARKASNDLMNARKNPENNELLGKPKEKFSLPHINFINKSKRLLPQSFSHQDQIKIRSIFGRVEEDRQFSQAKKQQVELLSPKKKRRRHSNVKMLYSNTPDLSNLMTLEMDMEVQGHRQLLSRKPFQSTAHSP